MNPETPTAMESLITSITSLVTAAVGWVGQYVTAITSNPLLLIFVVTAFVGLGVGLFHHYIIHLIILTD